MALTPRAHGIDLQPGLKAAGAVSKTRTPAETLKYARQRLEQFDGRLLAESRRIDAGRLGIPVFLARYGPLAASVVQGRRQMGKGASAEQAESSALMELAERYSFFSYRRKPDNAVRATYSEARARFGDACLNLTAWQLSVGDTLSPADAAQVLDLINWTFCPALEVATGRTVWLPLDWFALLNEYNGASAGNTDAESLLQGACELVERHVCCRIVRSRPELPTIDPATARHPAAAGLIAKFRANGVALLLKDFTLGMPVPTVGALAWDPATFPDQSEVVFTAGAAASPEGALIRALTEVAQLAGDFCTGSCYEPSGLPKYSRPDEAAWLLDGPARALDSLPSVASDDILKELLALARGLGEQGFSLYALRTTRPDLAIPAHYSMAPGLQFLERDANASLGLFVGRLLCERGESPLHGLAVLDKIYPRSHFVPFFQGLAALHAGKPAAAARLFARAEPLQPDADALALTAFYHGHALTLLEQWEQALAPLARAVAANAGVREYHSLQGVAAFRLGRFEEAAVAFAAALEVDQGSAADLANLGSSQKRLGKTAEAAHHLRAALKLDPDLEAACRELTELGG